MDNRLGCVTGLGVLAAAVLLAVVVAIVVFSGPVMFSPGSLNAEAADKPLGGALSHDELARSCGACHPAPWDTQTMADRCLICHTDVGAEIRTKDGIHGRLAVAAPGPTCRGCHPEHNGPRGILTDIEEATFPHDVTDFSLKSHAKQPDGSRFACKDCHPLAVTEFAETICIDCHARIDAGFMNRHLATWGRVCLPCHDGTGRNGARFDHNKLPFKLDGKHVGVPCEKCHANARSLKELQATARDCVSCHRTVDEHKGTFGTDCASCHTTATWANATFDHKTFPIDHGSEELKATCKTCHPQDAKTYTCYGCHEHTPANIANEHQGEVQGDITDCIRCHKGGQKSD